MNYIVCHAVYTTMHDLVDVMSIYNNLLKQQVLAFSTFFLKKKIPLFNKSTNAKFDPWHCKPHNKSLPNLRKSKPFCTFESIVHLYIFVAKHKYTDFNIQHMDAHKDRQVFVKKVHMVTYGEKCIISSCFFISFNSNMLLAFECNVNHK